MASGIERYGIVVTGAAGSIGSELCRQIIQDDPACLVCVDPDCSTLKRIPGVGSL